MTTPGAAPTDAGRGARSLLPIGLAVVAADVIMAVMVRDSLGDAVSLPVALLVALVLSAPVVLLLLARARRRPSRTAGDVPGSSAPWLERREWATGRIADATRARLAVSWLFAVSFSALSIPLLLAFQREFARDRDFAFALIFPAAALGLLVWAVRETLRWRRFGRSLLVLHTLPGVIGGHLRASLELATSELPVGPFTLCLRSVRRVVTGSGKNRSTRETPLWESEQSVPPTSARPGPRGTALDLDFTIPFECRPSDPRPSDDYVLWRLSVDAPYPGVDLSTAFEVPVFRTAESSEDVREAIGECAAAAALADRTGSLAGGVVRVRHWQGGRELCFPALRNPGVGLLGMLFGAGFSAVGLTDAPLFMRAIFVLVGGGIALVSLAMLLQSLRVRVDAGGVEVRTRYLLFGWTRRMARDEIGKLELGIGMHAGDRAYYDVHVVGRGPKRPLELVAGNRIPSKADAQAIAAVISQALGLERG